MTDTPLDSILNRTGQTVNQRSDTLYCNKKQAEKLVKKLNRRGILPKNIDDIYIRGLNVTIIPVDCPIVCKKGDIFNLAKDYKD